MQNAPNAEIATAFTIAALIAIVAGTAGTLIAGRTVWGIPRALLIDAASLGATGWLLALLSLSPWTRELGGVILVAIIVVRLAPAAVAVVSGAPAWLALVVAGGAYAALAAWLPVASLAFGDQVHYLLVADRLAQGRIDVAIDPRLFAEMIGVPPNADDVATHVADTPLGPRPIQGYTLSLLILPGWVVAQRLGAGIALALVAAWTSYQTLLILRDLLPARERAAGWTWLIASACAPLVLLATHIYPNVVGAALIATGYRLGFTAPTRRPVLAAAVLAATLFLTPRDAVPFAVLLAFLLRERTTRARVALAAGAVAVSAAAINALLYALPLPYAGYAFGTAQAQAVTQEGSITPFVWVTLPAILFDRTFGLAGSAPWVFIGLLGLVPAVRSDQARLVPAAAAVGVSIAALSFFRLWEGGYAPPARYFVDVLPLWTPFVAYALAVAWLWVERALIVALVATSALTSLVLAAAPSLALNSAFDDKVRGAVAGVLGIDPLGWLPSFQPVVPEWYVFAYLTLLPALAVAALLFVLGRLHDITLAVPPSGPLRLPAFLALNALLTLWTVAASMQPWVESGSDPVQESLLRRWLPLALALAAAGTALLSRTLAQERQGHVLARHFWIYLIPLGLMLAAHFGRPAVVNGQLGAIYLLGAVAFGLHALHLLWSSLGTLTDRGIALRLAGVALVAMLVLLPYHRAVMPTASDEPHYLIVTQSLVHDGDLDVRNDYEGDRYLAFYPERLPDMHAVPVGGAVFSIRDPALPILAAVPFGIAGRLGVLALMCLVGAALAAQLYLLLRDLRFSPGMAVIATATTALVHPIYTYTTQVYPELLVVLLFVTAVRVMRPGTAMTGGQLAVASALIGTLPWLSTRAWPIVVGLGLVLTWCALRSARGDLVRRAAAGAVPFVGLVLALSFLNWRTFGLFMPSAGYYLIRENQQVLTYTPWVGAPGLLFDRAFGLIPRAPVYLLAFVGVVPLWRRMRDGHGVQIAALGLGSLLSFVYIADIHYWWADGSPPSRYALGSIPLLIAAVAAGWEIALARAWSRALAGAAVFVSVVVAYVYAVLPNLRYDLAVDIRANASSGALFDFLAGASGIDPGLAFPSLVRADPASVALAAAWTLLAIALAVAGARIALRR